MPGFDGTGPRGMGTMTGGGRGFCGSWRARPRYGRGWGIQPIATPYRPPYAYGGLSYQGAAYAPGMSEPQELDFLKVQVQNLEDQLKQINNRIKELES